MSTTRVVNANTSDLIKAMCAGCCERAGAIRAELKKHDYDADSDTTIHAVNTMALNYFIGATACANALGIQELAQHLTHFLMTEVQPWGYVAVERNALNNTRRH